jgi:Ferritin-like
MPEDARISGLLEVPQEERGLEWLKAALQTAARLEFATIPPYLCAMWSIKSGDGKAYEHLREVVMEEMLHLGLVCNMLTSIGETPKLYPEAAPAYPCSLPGGVRPGLEVPLKGLTRDGIRDVFMEIEKPHHDVSGVDPTDETDPTIGDFYDAILAAFSSLPEWTATNQRQLAKQIRIRDGVQAFLFKIESKTDVAKAIGVIKEQGEGTASSPLDTYKGMSMDLAHYFRFAELFHGKEIVFEAGIIEFTGPDIPFPDVYPMAEVPAGGHQGPDLPPAVAEKLSEFDQAYTTMLKQLQAAWEHGQIGKLNASVGTMFSLTDLATELMQMEMSQGDSTYGPCFRISE